MRANPGAFRARQGMPEKSKFSPPTQIVTPARSSALPNTSGGASFGAVTFEG